MAAKVLKNCFFFGIILERVSPWSEEAEEDKDNGEEVAEEQFEEDVQGVHGVPGENILKTKVFFFSLDNQTSWRECRRPDRRRPQWTWWYKLDYGWR